MARHASILPVLILACALDGAQAFVSGGLHIARSARLRDASARAQPGAFAKLRMDSEDWTAAQDPATGQTYWYNSVTQESSWEPPAQSEPEERGMASYGPRIGRLMEVPESQKKNAFRGGKDGLVEAMNPIKPGVIWYKEPSLLGFFGFKIGIILWAIFVGFHNQYAGDFGPFITFHDGQVDLGQASREWARLHGGYVPPVPKQ